MKLTHRQGFRGFSPFTCPEQVDNKCNDKQKAGFNWGDLAPGRFSSYGGFNWRGFTCDDKPFQKRADLATRTFGGKHISGTCGPDKASAPSFGSGSVDVDKFSITVIDIVVEFDVDLELHYDMPDGSLCKQRSSCSRAGSSIKNTQCGGAKNVTIIYPPQKNKPKPTCSFGIHSIGFDCKPPVFTPPPRPTHTLATSIRSTSTSTSTSSVAALTTAPPLAFSTSTIFETVVQTVTKCGPSIHNCPAKNGTVVLTTVVVAVSTTICPVTETSTAKALETTRTHVAPPPPPPSPPAETLPCPDVVPRCLNTWIFLVGCKDNTDHGCYCPSQVFVENVFTCIFAHGETDIIISQAITFFQGICAPYVPKNPCIATGAATVTDAIAVTAAPTHVPQAVYTTVVVDTTVVEPCPTGLTTKHVNTVLTVPQVGFQTDSADQVALVPLPTVQAALPPAGGPQTTFYAGVPAATGGLRPTTTARALFTGAAVNVRPAHAGWLAGLAVAVAALAL